jgi:hypothetical protein
MVPVLDWLRLTVCDCTVPPIMILFTVFSSHSKKLFFSAYLQPSFLSPILHLQRSQLFIISRRVLSLPTQLIVNGIHAQMTPRLGTLGRGGGQFQSYANLRGFIRCACSGDNTLKRSAGRSQ